MHLVPTKNLCVTFLSTSTVIYSQYIENTNNFFKDFYQSMQISGKWYWNDQTNSLKLIRLEVLGQKMVGTKWLVLYSCTNQGKVNFEPGTTHMNCK